MFYTIYYALTVISFFIFYVTAFNHLKIERSTSNILKVLLLAPIFPIVYVFGLRRMMR